MVCVATRIHHQAHRDRWVVQPVLSEVGEPLKGLLLLMLAQGGERLSGLNVRGRESVVRGQGGRVQVLKRRLHVSRILDLVLARVVWQVYGVGGLCPQAVVGPKYIIISQSDHLEFLLLAALALVD